MADIQHADLPNNLLHEPLHIQTSTTSDSGKVITPSSVTNGESQLRYLTVGDITNSGATSWTGWAQYADSTYTSASKLAVSAGVRTKVTIDGLGTRTNTSGLPSGVSSFWNTGTNKLTPASVNDAYDIRLNFKCALDSTSADRYVDVELDIGGSIGVVAANTYLMIKDTATHQFIFNFPVFSAATFIANGGEFYVTPSFATDFWDFEVLVVRTHKGA